MSENWIKNERERVTDRVHELIIDKKEGTYINYIRDRFTDMDLLLAYEMGIKEGKRVKRKKK